MIEGDTSRCVYVMTSLPYMSIGAFLTKRNTYNSLAGNDPVDCTYRALVTQSHGHGNLQSF